MKKKERPVIFPNHDSTKPLPAPPTKAYKLQVGTTFRVGNPANRSYLFLSDSLKPNTSTFNQEVPIGNLVDQIVTIKGILELSDSRTAILERKDNGHFFKGQNRIYADVDNAVVAKELIAL